MNGKMRGNQQAEHHELLRSIRSECGIGWQVGCRMIDWKRVGELRDEIGADGFAEVADMFLEEAEGAVQALLAGPPAEEVGGQLHFLKGSALNLGLAELAALCQEGERQAAAGQSMDMARLAAVWQSSREGLLAGLAVAAGAA